MRNAHARLGTASDLLRLSARALDASTHDQHRGVAIRPSAIANGCIAAFQEDRERRSDDLEAAVRCRKVVASTQCTTLHERRLRGKTIQRRSRCANENAADEGSRLDLFTHLLTEPQDAIVSPLAIPHFACTFARLTSSSALAMSSCLRTFTVLTLMASGDAPALISSTIFSICGVRSCQRTATLLS